MDLGFAVRQRSVIMTQLAEARARAGTLVRELGPAPDQFADLRQGEEHAIATLAMMDRLAG
jgi:hypothetical protein